ncbi:hypothetical protein [Paracnuella aquatica]|uniref:hypothetical protein n=1 Tax=Paracnuella aquatica TaxID=2268757 RepID=UPI000DEF47B3|nr:hypothetical protein [Paracnuella aquatica]RPD44212.1 hypothetical protein DRJ53_17660 [Paracnuella aquatica]
MRQLEPDVSKPEFPTTEVMKNRVSLLKEVSEVLKKVYEHPKAYYEVNATILSGHYEDERVLLKDLLFPETSPLYQKEAFKAFKAHPGSFKQQFYSVLEAGSFPHLKAALGAKRTATNNQLSGMQPKEQFNVAIATDTAREIFSNSNGVAIYFPYSENFGSNFTPAYFDNINTDPHGNLATIVAADRIANTAPGSEPYQFLVRYGPAKEDSYLEIRYRSVIVDDSYAELKPTHIIGIGAEIIMDPPAQPPVVTSMNRVYVGWVRIGNNKQGDWLVSYGNGNGGGSEFHIARISGYLKMENQQVTNFEGDDFPVTFKRKEIRKGRWKRVYGVWDPDWKTNNYEQILAVWEADFTGTATFTGSITTTATVTLSPGNTATATRTLGFSIPVSTEDQIYKQRKQDRPSYFAGAKIDQGWGFQMCDDKGCKNDNTFLPSGQSWPKFDQGTDFGFTWPYNTF